MPRRLAPLGLAICLLTALVACTPPLIGPAPPRFFALNLPTTTPLADRDSQPVAGAYRSLRLLLDTGRLPPVQTLFGETDKGQLLAPGHSLGMAFSAPRDFWGVAVSVQRQGPGPTAVRLTLRRDSARGPVLASQVLPDVPQHGWVEVRLERRQPGRYHVELSDATAQGLYWRASDLIQGALGPWPNYQRTVPFKLPETLADIPQYDGGSLSMLVNVRAERIFILGGRSSYDKGLGNWGDYEARDDPSDRQFIGDRVGEMEIDYADGSRDVAPIIVGLNQWSWKYWGDAEAGGPFLEPFATTPRPMIASLHLYTLGQNPAAPYFWVYRPRAKIISRIRLSDNSQIQGYPVVAAITIEAASGGPNSSALPAATLDESTRDWLDDNTISPDMIAGNSYEPALSTMAGALYSSRATMPRSLALDVPADHRGPSFQVKGGAAADVLTNVYYHSLKDLLGKIEPTGVFHTSSYNAPNYGLYGGVGAWRNGVGYFYNAAWARDMGRALLEMARLGFLEQAEAGLSFASKHLYDLSNNFPGISRAGVRVPPHWGTVLGQPNVIDIDGMGDDNQENDGHGLLLLAYVRTWQERGRSVAWLERYWQAINDAAEWYCYQLENPSFSRAKGVLYTESEASNDGGYDVYSNLIAVEALRGTAEMARTRGVASTAARWDGCADRISRGVREQLTDSDARYGVTWRPVAWTWAYAHESLAPAFLPADLTGYSLGEGSTSFAPSVTDTLTVSRNTFRRQTELASGFRSGRVLGYGQAFLTQAALMLDDMAAAGEALDYLARFIYDPDLGPYLVPEGIALHRNSGSWYRIGDLGNAVHEAEVLKTLALLAGVDDLNGRALTLMPRIPPTWTGISVADYPVTVQGQRFSVAYDLTRQANRMTMAVQSTQPVPLLEIRVGPLPRDASPTLTVDGRALPPDVLESGGWRWVRVHNLVGVTQAQIEVRW